MWLLLGGGWDWRHLCGFLTHLSGCQVLVTTSTGLPVGTLTCVLSMWPGLPYHMAAGFPEQVSRDRMKEREQAQGRYGESKSGKKLQHVMCCSLRSYIVYSLSHGVLSRFKGEGTQIPLPKETVARFHCKKSMLMEGTAMTILRKCNLSPFGSRVYPWSHHCGQGILDHILHHPWSCRQLSEKEAEDEPIP